MNIEQILEDLYALEPALRSEEAELKEIIEKMISRKPDAEPDEAFKNRLKAELLDKVEQKKRRIGFFIVHRKQIAGAAGIAAAVVIALSFALRPGLISNIMSPDRRTAGEQFAEEAFGYEEKSIEGGDNAAALPAESQSAETLSEAAPSAMKQSEAPRRAAEKRIESIAGGASITADIAVDAPVSESIAMMKSSSPKEFEAGIDADEISIMPEADDEQTDGFSGEEYKSMAENPFMAVADEPLSTFSIDVDTASYSNVRRFINNGMLPYSDAVRIEELINYFSYDYPQPEPGRPFSFTSELSECPWNDEHRLLLVGLQGYDVQREQLPPSNIVFLIDSSGSMYDDNKLPLLKDSISLLVDNLRSDDYVSIVAYAGSAGLVLPPTPGNSKERILQALDSVEAGGSTAGGAGIDLAYSTAAENLLEGGNNRVIIATDGDFNVGQSSENELKEMIEARRDQGIFLTVLGLGMGNYKDAQMEALADNGNGNYAYIDTLNEANKVLVEGMSGTLLTIAKDVKIQIDFNSGVVESYRLIGYENRVMAAEDFENDKKDAGEIGAGHSVTALYEIIPAGEPAAEDLAEIRFRYKRPDEDQSLLLKAPVPNKFRLLDDASENFRFAAAVAEWGLILKNSPYRSDSDINRIIRQAVSAAGQDSFGYRNEFIDLLHQTGALLK